MFSFTTVLSIYFLYPLKSEVNMAYSQLQKVKANTYIKASIEQFYDVLCNRTHHVANIFPGKVQPVKIHKGEWGTEGSIISWNYLHSTQILTSKLHQQTTKFRFCLHVLKIMFQLLKNYRLTYKQRFF